MGTHISKVKSVDLDVWTPEQMAVRAFYYLLCAPTEPIFVVVDPKVG